MCGTQLHRSQLEKNRSSCLVPINLHLSMRLVVQKYGGTSVGTPERIGHVAQRILETQRQGCRVVAVVSAMAGDTDELLRLGHAVAPQPMKRELDILLSTGEPTAITRGPASRTSVQSRSTSCSRTITSLSWPVFRGRPRKEKQLRLAVVART